MKQMSIRIRVLKTELQKDTSYEQPKETLPMRFFPEDVYEAPADKMKAVVTNYIIKHVSSCEFNESFKNLTQTGFFELPIKNTVLHRDYIDNDGNLIKGNLLFKNGKRLYEGNQIIIDMGYDDHYQQRFIGYITKFIESGDYIRIEFEDTMYKLKNSISMKKSFPKIVQNLLGEYETFNIYHLVQWITQVLYDKNQENHLTFVPKTRTYSTALGKLLIKDPITPAEIYKYYFKDVYKMSIFFRNEYVSPLHKKKTNYDYLLEPVLYVGWDNWDEQEYIETNIVKTIVDGKIEYKAVTVGKDKNSPLRFEDKESLLHRQYSQIFKFQYPYIPSSIEKYNPIIENNLEWYNTEKDNIKVTATSFNSTLNKNIVVTYQYNEFKSEELNKPIPPYTPDEIEKFNKAQLDAYEKAEKLRKKQERDEKAKNADVGEIADSNNLQVFNEISLIYPNLNVDQLIDKIKFFLKTYPDSGLRGSFTALGEPYVRQGDIVQLQINSSHIENVDNIVKDSPDKFYTKYYVKSVNTTFNNSTGIRQEITIDKKVN